MKGNVAIDILLRAMGELAHVAVETSDAPPIAPALVDRFPGPPSDVHIDQQPIPGFVRGYAAGSADPRSAAWFEGRVRESIARTMPPNAITASASREAIADALELSVVDQLILARRDVARLTEMERLFERIKRGIARAKGAEVADCDVVAIVDSWSKAAYHAKKKGRAKA